MLSDILLFFITLYADTFCDFMLRGINRIKITFEMLTREKIRFCFYKINLIYKQKFSYYNSLYNNKKHLDFGIAVQKKVERDNFSSYCLHW